MSVDTPLESTPRPAAARPDAAGPLSTRAEYEVDLPRYPRGPLTPLVRELSAVNGWRSAALIALQWAVILAAGGAAIASGHWAVYILAMFVIATRMQYLGVMLHDGAHWLLFRNRTVNDLVSDFCCAFPLSMSTTLYRKTHLQHHRLTNSPDDPDPKFQADDPDWWEWPKTRWGCFWALVRTITGLNVYRLAAALRMWSPALNLFTPLGEDYPLAHRVLFVVGAVLFNGLLIWAGLFWHAMLLLLVPALTVLNLMNRLRTTAEHVGTRQTHELNSSRSIVPSWWERLTVAPYNVSLHLEHHLFPSVPGPNLGRLHAALMQDPEFRRQAHVTRGYLGVLRELMTPRAEPTDPPPAAFTEPR